MGEPALSSISAVVVTYNRLEKLRQCVRSILDQTVSPSMAIVVDNASTDGTKEWLTEMASKDARLKPVHLPENTGGAGGFHEGIRIALRSGVEYVWIMDDDSYPRPDALAALLDAFSVHQEELGGFPAFACSRVLWSDEISPCAMNTPALLPQWDRPYSDRLHAVAARSCSFVSCLFRSNDVKRVGLPLKEYFIWFDDVEYTRRMSFGRYGLVVLDSVVIHDMKTNAGVSWSRITPENLWQFQYGMRNEAAWRLRMEGPRSFFWFVTTIRSLMKRGGVRMKLRLGIYWWALKALRFNPKPEFPD